MEGSDERNILFDGMRYYYCLNASLVDYALSISHSQYMVGLKLRQVMESMLIDP